MGEKIRVLLVDDHPFVRETLRFVVDGQSGMEVVGVASDGAEAVTSAQTLRPDVILIDLVMPRMGGVEAIREIVRRDPQARILMVTLCADVGRILMVIEAGASEYLPKEPSVQKLVQLIRGVHRGELSLHPTIARGLVWQVSQPSDLPPTKDPLTPCEMEILQLTARGLSSLTMSYFRDALSE